MSDLQNLLAKYRKTAQTEREKGTYFEELIICYLKNEATYKDLYSDIWTYADWAKIQKIDGKDTGIDLVAKTNGTNEYHAIQCKFYAEDHRIQKADIDSFFTASGKEEFSHRIIVTTTNNWGGNAEAALQGQQPPVSTIDLHDLENSQIDWSQFQPDKAPVLKEKHGLRPHQQEAHDQVVEKLKDVDRGKMIMACGTGKTFTSLKIAETITGAGKRVLFLVPSLSLLSQTLSEWTQQSKIPLHSFAVCSDSDIGKKRKKDDDIVQTFTHELRYPATTNAKSLASEMNKRHDATHMSVVFSTYHSIAVISEAQKNHGLDDFDLIICDEAHRTTGATFEGDEESKFVRVHDNDFIDAKKRLYMTATPRIYGEGVKAIAEKDNTMLSSMDDEAIFGKQLYLISFSEAVSRNLLVDYKVIILTVDAAHISTRIQGLLADENNSLKVDDAAKIIGCWKALSKQDQDDDLADDSDPMRRALAFCQVIEPNTNQKSHKVSSKNIASMFQDVVEEYQQQEQNHNSLKCEANHVDGSMNATAKSEKLAWLKEKIPDDTCRILSNVRCLSEGVDIPALDAILFLTPRNSQVDVVQSVGRIMRKSPGKTRGYVILPVVIPAGVEPHKALDDNKIYKVVWDVLRALRSHDDRFDANVNKWELNGPDHRKIEIISVTDKINKKSKTTAETKNKDAGKGSHNIGAIMDKPVIDAQDELQFEVSDIDRAIYAKIVKKCGNRYHWEEWANDIAKIAQTHITRITSIVNDPENTHMAIAFKAFADELRDDLNDSITDDEVIEMLAQHMITKPVFDALFEEYSFAKNNPVSQAMQIILDMLQEHNLHKETDTLQKFYGSVKMRAEGINNAEGKQKIVVELYDKFFKNAFPKMTERLGIVYTPVEVVDFIIHSVNDVLKSEFNQNLGSAGVHIIDPFTGTGTFITRMLQSGLITKEQLPHKYKHEIHANEIVLLAYYIAAINIEAVYHSLMGGDYAPFEGICLTDTFQLYEKDDMISKLLVDNSARRTRQKQLDIRVIMGNPPYSTGQKSADDDNENIRYTGLDGRINETYVKKSSVSMGKNNAYDSYIRAIRWASDRLSNNGLIGFVSGSGFLEKSSMDGLRECLSEEFSNIYIINLRGDIRKNMLSGGRAKEGENIFESGSMTGIAISILVKNTDAKEYGKIYYHDIGDDLSQQEKTAIICDFKSINGITAACCWQVITPDKHNDWLNQRDDSFEQFIEMGTKKDKNATTVFNNYSSGVKTNRDTWCYNSSKEQLKTNIEKTSDFYLSELQRFKKDYHSIKEALDISKFITVDPEKISWSLGFKNALKQQKEKNFDSSKIFLSQYRPFIKQWMCFDRQFNEIVYQTPNFYPEQDTENRTIYISGVGARSGFSLIMTGNVMDMQLIDNGQCFPLKLYEKIEDDAAGGLFTQQKGKTGYRQKDAISDAGLAHFKAAYPNEDFTKEDLFYYIYGLLHSVDYRSKYADNLSKQLPRIPCVKTAADFWAFVVAGRKLGALHLDYETVEPYPVMIEGDPKSDQDYYVTKMKYGKDGKDKDKSTVIYNDHITIKDIPLEAYDYIVNGKSALDWVIDRQCVKTDKKSGITNDANDYAIETVGDAKYPLQLFLRVITVSLETMKIVNGLAKFDIITDD